MAVSDYSTTPGSNTSISGISIAENCSPANINNAIRQMMADIKTWYATFSSFMLTFVGSADAAAARTSLSVYSQAQVDALISNVPAGMIAHFAMSTAPTGYLAADGTAVSRTTYATLFTAIGTTFGAGNGTTTFNLPDLRGEFMRGYDNGRGIDSGRVFGSAQTDEYEAHTHRIFPDKAGQNDGPGSYVQGALSTASYGSVSTASSGGTETRPRNIALLACIKT